MTPVVAVTGSEGFIGCHVAAALADRGATVRRLDLRAAHPAQRHDVRRPLVPPTLAGSHTVVHLAALGGVAPSLRHPHRYHATNVVGTAHVIAAARHAGARRLVLASSSSVYGHCPEPATEQRALRPLSPYAESKVRAEELAEDATGDLEVVVVRPFTVIGPGQRPDMLLARMLRGEAVVLWPFVRDFTAVDDVARAIAIAATAPMASRFEIFNLGSGRPTPAPALVDVVAAVTGAPPQVSWGPRRPAEPTRTWSDSRRAARHLGFRPASSLAATVAAQLGTSRPGAAALSPA